MTMIQLMKLVRNGVCCVLFAGDLITPLNAISSRVDQPYGRSETSLSRLVLRVASLPAGYKVKLLLLLLLNIPQAHIHISTSLAIGYLGRDATFSAGPISVCSPESEHLVVTIFIH